MKFLLSRFIKYLEKTTDEQWQLDKVGEPEMKKWCVMGHLFCWAAGKEKDEKRANRIWNYFEGAIATTYMIYPVNDGKNSNYPQATPKERCIAYLKNLRDDKEKTTIDHWNDYDKLAPKLSKKEF